MRHRYLLSYRLIDILIIIFVVITIIAPTTFDLFKLFTLSVIICLACIKFFVLGDTLIHINRTLIISLASILWVNMVQALMGIIRNGDYALADIQINVLYFFVFFVLIFIFSNDSRTIKSINLGLLLGSLLLPLYTILLVIKLRTGGMSGFYDFLDMDYMIAYGDGFFKVYGLNILSYAFTVPYTYVYFRLSSAKSPTRLMLLCLFVLNALALIITKRRGIMLSSMIVIVMFEIYELKNKEMMKRIIVILSGSVLLFTMFMILQNFINVDILNKVFLSKSSDSLRIEQIKMLLEGFKDNPIIGNGYGAHFIGYSRLTQFEMQYFKLLFTGGIMAFIVYFTGYLAIIVSLKRTLGKVGEGHRQLLCAAFFTQFALLLNNAVNPFITQFSAMFHFFIPFYMLNNISKYKRPHLNVRL